MFVGYVICVQHVHVWPIEKWRCHQTNMPESIFYDMLICSICTYYKFGLRQPNECTLLVVCCHWRHE